MNAQTIQKLKVENIKGIKHIEIHANNVNEICGENGAGKSSILDSIAFAFGGKKVIDKKAIRDGEEKGEINIETDDLLITRKFTSSGTTLTVKSKAGGSYAQTDLNKIFNMISFDPLQFSRSSKEDQVKLIKEILGDEFNKKMANIKKEFDFIYEKRTEIGRKGKAIGEISLPEKVKKVDVSALMEELESKQLQNIKTRDKNEEILKEKDALDKKKSIVEDLKKRMNDLRDQYAKTMEEVGSLTKKIESSQIEPIIDCENLYLKIKNAAAINDQASAYDRAVELQSEKEALKDDYLNRSLDLKSLDEAKENLMANANLPVKGLMIGDEGVTLFGIPIEQISSAEKLMLSTKIACSINSDLKVLMIKDGSLLDDKSFDLIKDYSGKNGYQLWIETVGNGKSQDSIKISEGEISND